MASPSLSARQHVQSIRTKNFLLYRVLFYETKKSTPKSCVLLFLLSFKCSASKLQTLFCLNKYLEVEHICPDGLVTMYIQFSQKSTTW
jgi:hypothetical protein